MSEVQVHVVANASGGRALRAFKVLGSDAPVIGPHVLETPPNIAIRGSLDPQRTEELSFIGTEEYKGFFEKISRTGWSAAVNAEVGWRLGSLKMSGKAKEEEQTKTVTQQSKKVRNVVVTQCLYVPMKCFQIPQSQMFLTEAVIADAKAVADEKQAAIFLKKYNTHVYAGLYHIGGIFIREVSVTSSEEVEARFLAEKALLELGASAELSYKSPFVDINADAKFSSTASNDVISKASRAVKCSKTEEIIHVWGATSAINKNDFMQKLEADPSKWAIIDKAFDHPHDLIGIWDIMAQDEDLKNPASVIYNYYQKEEANNRKKPEDENK